MYPSFKPAFTTRTFRFWSNFAVPFNSLQAALTSGETLVFAHRGDSLHAPQNTLAAFALAAEHGAQGIELDVQLSSDGRLVVIHDETVDATTDGQGEVAKMTLAQLKQLDAGGWFSREFAGERIPTLDEVFAVVGDKLLINVEIKASAPGIESAVADCIHRHAMDSRILVSSFDRAVLSRCRGVMTLPLAYLHGSPEIATIDDMPTEALHPWHELVDAGYMRRAREMGCHVNTWTVNDPARACELKLLGVNAIITDDPAAILAALRQC